LLPSSPTACNANFIKASIMTRATAKPPRRPA